MIFTKTHGILQRTSFLTMTHDYHYKVLKHTSLPALCYNVGLGDYPTLSRLDRKLIHLIGKYSSFGDKPFEFMCFIMLDFFYYYYLRELVACSMHPLMILEAC